VVAADTLKRADIPEELLKKIGGGDKDKALAELVAVLGEDLHAQGDSQPQLATVAFSPDGMTLAVGGTEQVVRRIDLATGKPLPELKWKPRSDLDHVYSLAFSPDGKMLAVGGSLGSVALWDAAGGAEVRSLMCPDVQGLQVAFSPDGTLLATAGKDNGAVVRLWQVATGQLMFTARFPGDTPAWCVAFSPDGKTLAAGLDSGEVRLGDLAVLDGRLQVHEIKGFPSSAFSSPGPPNGPRGRLLTRQPTFSMMLRCGPIGGPHTDRRIGGGVFGGQRGKGDTFSRRG
jgi:WD40 repeat protein